MMDGPSLSQPPPKMKLKHRLLRYYFVAVERIIDREIIRAEQTILLVLMARKRRFLDEGSAHPSLDAPWVNALYRKNAAMVAEMETSLTYRIAALGRLLFRVFPRAAAHNVRRLFDHLRAGEDDRRSIDVYRASALTPAAGPIGVVAHIFYPDVAFEIREYLEAAPGTVDLFISTDREDKREIIQQAFADWDRGAVEVRLAPNRGRDIAPKLITFRDVYDRYDYVLHLHSKRSPHSSNLKLWRYFIYESLMGDRDLIAGVLSAFARDPKLGMIAPEHFFTIHGNISWDGNLAMAAPLARRMGLDIDPNAPVDFPSGSMFWARSAALRPLLDLELPVDAFCEEAGQADSTLAHAIERLYFYSCEAAGLRWATVSVSALAKAQPNLATRIKQALGLVSAIKVGRRLTPAKAQADQA